MRPRESAKASSNNKHVAKGVLRENISRLLYKDYVRIYSGDNSTR